MKTFTIQVDKKMDRILNELKRDLGQTSKAAVLRMGVALLKVAAEVRNSNGKLVITNSKDEVEKEILLV